MSKLFAKFLFKIVIFSFIITSLAFSLFFTVLKPYYLPVFPYLVLLIATITSVGHFWVEKAAAQNTMKFTTAFMASVTVKLMVYLFFMLIYLLNDHSQAIPFVLTFMILYIFFTIFEVVQILGIVKK